MKVSPHTEIRHFDVREELPAVTGSKVQGTHAEGPS